MKTNPVVILHGWGLSGQTFAPTVAAFEQLGFPVYNPDLPGFGKSAIPVSPLTISDYADFLEAYLEENKITRPVIIGHSFGGRVALKFNERYQNRTCALVLTGVPGFTPIPKKKLMVFIALARAGNFIFSLPPLSLFQDQVRRWYYYAVGAKEFFRAQGSMRETFKQIVQEDLVRSMEAVSVPTLLIWGELDTIVPLPIAERMHRVIVGSELVIIPDADHGVPFKEPKRFVSHVQRFLESL